MAAGGNIICGSQNLGDLLGNENLPCSSELLDSFWLPKSSPSLQGQKTTSDLENVGGGTTRAAPFQSLGEEENGYEDFDGCFNPHGGKKRRLTASQVQFLEKNFELENKLEPDRKIHLAKELGLQPRQVAIWFQNRRARSKNQRLEKDFDSLKAVYDKLKDDYQSLLKENKVLQNEVLLLKDKLVVKGKEDLETFDDAIKLLEAEAQKPITNTTEACKKEEAIFDYDSPHYTEGNHSSLTDPADSSSQDDDDNLSKGLLPPPCFLKLEDCCYDDDPPTNSCNFGFSMEDHPFWSWPY